MATNAGGMCCVKYGVTAEYVLGPGGRARLRRGVAHRSPYRQGGRRLRPDPAVRRVGGHARGHHGGDDRAATARRRIADADRGLPHDGRRGRSGRGDLVRRAVAEPAGAARPDAPAGDRGATDRWGCVPTPRRCCWPSVDTGSRAPADLAGSRPPARRPARSRCTARPTRSRRRRCCARGGWRTRRWRSSPPRRTPRARAGSSSTTSPCRARRWRRCSTASRRSPRSTTYRSAWSATPATATCTPTSSSTAPSRQSSSGAAARSTRS